MTKTGAATAVFGIDIDKKSFHVVGHDARGRHRAAAKVVAWPSESAARQSTAMSGRYGACVGDRVANSYELGPLHALPKAAAWCHRLTSQHMRDCASCANRTRYYVSLAQRRANTYNN